MQLSDPAMLTSILEARTVAQLEAVLGQLPIVSPEQFHLNHDGEPEGEWRDNHLHWLPVGRDRGNGGRIKLASQPTNPIAERLVNGMEAVIELERLRELRRDPAAPVPISPRDAMKRYFGLPRLDSIPAMEDSVARRQFMAIVDELRAKLHVHLSYEKKSKEFAVVIRDQGMGQHAEAVHRTLLSLGRTDKGDKPYMIGVFGQGGSSAFATSKCSIIVSRRAGDLADGTGALGWSVVRQVSPTGRRDPYFAYLAASVEGTVPSFSSEIADEVGFGHGSHFCHLQYDFGGFGSRVSFGLYQALNHVLFNPIMPYDLFTLEKKRPELMQGTAQRLARRTSQLGGVALDKVFPEQPVGNPVEERP